MFLTLVMKLKKPFIEGGNEKIIKIVIMSVVASNVS